MEKMENGKTENGKMEKWKNGKITRFGCCGANLFRNSERQQKKL